MASPCLISIAEDAAAFTSHSMIRMVLFCQEMLALRGESVETLRCEKMSALQGTYVSLSPQMVGA